MITWSPGNENIQDETPSIWTEWWGFESFILLFRERNPQKEKINKSNMLEETTCNGRKSDTRMVKLPLDTRFEKLAVQKLDFTQELKRGQMRLRPTGYYVILRCKTDKWLKRRAEPLSVYRRPMSMDQISCLGFQLQLKFLWAGFMN